MDLAREKKLPKISIVTVCLNNAPSLEKTIRSVMTQNYNDYEHIVMDGGSNDGSLDIMQEYRGKIIWDSCIRKMELGATLNAGFHRASGDIFCRLNANECLLPGALMIIGEYFSEHPEIDLVCGRAKIIAAGGKGSRQKLAPAFDFNDMIKWRNLPPVSSCFFRREPFIECGAYDVKLKKMLDYDLFLKLAKNKKQFSRLPKTLSMCMDKDMPRHELCEKDITSRVEKLLLLFKYGKDQVIPELEKLVTNNIKYEKIQKHFIMRSIQKFTKKPTITKKG